MTNESTSTRRPRFMHCMILGSSTFLIGLYFGPSISTGVDLIALQTGLIGLLGFMALTRIPEKQIIHRAVETPHFNPRAIVPSRRVERRLARHVQKQMRRIDEADSETRPVSVKIAEKTANSIRVSSD